MFKDKEVKKNVKNILLSICDVKVLLTFTFTEYGTVLTTILPILFLYLNTVTVTAGAFIRSRKYKRDRQCNDQKKKDT
jgi:hypothetical protein